VSPPAGSSEPGSGLAADGSVIVVGASLSGLRAAETLRAEGFVGKISLVGDEPHLPYDRPPLSKQVLSGKWPPEKAVLADRHRASELLLHEVLGRRAVSLDVEQRSIELADGEVLTADAVVLACGAVPRSLPGTEGLTQGDGLFTLRTLDDSLALRAAVTATDGARVVVIGAGFIGAEVASTCAAMGCRVTVLEVLDIPLRNILGPVLGGHCASLYAAHDVDLRTGVSVAGVRKGGEGGEGDERDEASPLVVELSGGETVPAEVVVVGIGVRPCTDWLVDSGLSIQNGVVCDDRLFAADRVVAAGDVANWLWRHDDEEEQIRIEHWEVAAQGGMASARALLVGRAHARAFTPVPYFWSDQFDIRFQVIGSPRGDDDVEIVDGSLSDGKFVALFGRGGRLRAVMALGRPRQLMGYRPLLERGAGWDEALAHEV
jgi:NADPH-dependent 2,4-dienoyl-CoA reductase/sulfur reductase-like enzyme